MVFLDAGGENIERAKCLEAALAGVQLLETRFRDPRTGAATTRRSTIVGEPVDTRKHVYLNSFALYGMVAYHQATQDRQVLRRAQELFQRLDQHAHDARERGLSRVLLRGLAPDYDPSEPTYVGAIGTKTYNTHLHLLESFAALYRVWPDATVRQRLEELVRINTTTVQHPEYRCNIDGWRPDWRMVDQPRNLRASYGHDVECLWLTLDAVRALGDAEALYRGWAESLADYSLDARLRCRARRVLLHRSARRGGGRHPEGMVGAGRGAWSVCWSSTG